MVLAIIPNLEPSRAGGIILKSLLGARGTLARVRQLSWFIQEFSIPLVVGVFAGLLVANVDNHSYERLVDYSLFGGDIELFGHLLTSHFLINEMFMVLFFGIAAKEITDSVLPGGVLNPVTKAINSLMGTLGGVLGPAGVYLLLTFLVYGGTENFSVVAKGWAIPTATDIALAWLVARLVFGPMHPAVSFLLLLAIADDAIGLGIIAVFYPDPDHPVAPVWLLLTAGGMVVALAMRRAKLSSWVPYVVIGGAISWVGLIKASIEPALALVPIVPFLPGLSSTAAGSSPRKEQTPTGVPGSQGPSHSPLEQFEHHLKLPVTLGLFFFAFANAGVPIGNMNAVTWIVLFSLIGGKLVGISIFSAVAVRLGFPLPGGMGGRHLVVAALVAGLGLTVALFVAGKAFTGPPFLDPAKMGAVFSGGVAFLALAAGYLLKVKGQVSATTTTP